MDRYPDTVLVIVFPKTTPLSQATVDQRPDAIFDGSAWKSQLSDWYDTAIEVWQITSFCDSPYSSQRPVGGDGNPKRNGLLI